MNEYNRSITTEENESPQALLSNEEQQMMSASTPIWSNNNTPLSCIIPPANKLGDTTPNTPGTYYATIQSSSSRWYAMHVIKYTLEITMHFYSQLQPTEIHFTSCDRIKFTIFNGKKLAIRFDIFCMFAVIF